MTSSPNGFLITYFPGRSQYVPLCVLTSELWGEQQGLEQRVEVAGAPLVLDAAQIASSTGRRWPVSPLCNSSPGKSRREALLLLFLEKIPKHSV